MNKAIKKLRKLKDQLDKIEEKEDEILSQIDEAIDELEENEDQDVESGSGFCCGDDNFFRCCDLLSDFDSSLIFFKGC